MVLESHARKDVKTKSTLEVKDARGQNATIGVTSDTRRSWSSSSPWKHRNVGMLSIANCISWIHGVLLQDVLLSNLRFYRSSVLTHTKGTIIYCSGHSACCHGMLDPR